MGKHWLREWLYREDNFALIDQATGSGWLDGGCLILADALVEWLGEGAEPYFLIGGTSGSDGRPVDWPEHALVRYGDIYLDGDGESSEEALLKRWAEEEGIEEGWLAPSTEDLRKASLEGGIPIDLDLSARLAGRLKEAFPVIGWPKPEPVILT